MLGSMSSLIVTCFVRLVGCCSRHTTYDIDVDDAEPELDDQVENDEGDNANPLSIFYDCETTASTIIAASLLLSPPVPVPVDSPTFTSLVAPHTTSW